MSKLLLVEDEIHKRDEINSCIKEVFDLLPDMADSVSSAVLKVKSQNYDLIILDMTLPTYDASPDEPADDTHIFGGREFLSQMERFDIVTPVIVFTQFELFGKPPNEMRIEDLDRELKEEFTDSYNGTIYYHASLDSWKYQLKELLIATSIISR